MDGLDELYPSIPSHASAMIFSGPNNWGLDNVFDWIRNAVDDIGNWVLRMIQNSARTVIRGLTTVIDLGMEGLRVTVGPLSDYISRSAGWLWDQVSRGFDTAWTLQAQLLNGLIGNVSSLFSTTWEAIEKSGTWLYNGISSAIASTFSGIWQGLTWLTGEITSALATIPNLVSSAVTSSVGVLWEGFLGMFTSFGSWVWGLLDSVGDWFNVDIPGHSPRWHMAVESPLTFVKDLVTKWSSGDEPGAVQDAFNGIVENVAWAGNVAGEIIDSFNDAITAASGVSEGTSIADAPQHASNIGGIAITSFMTLASMSLAGELLHPLKNLGLGRFAHMIFNMTKYDEVTGAYMHAFANAALKVPLHHYFNDKYRPEILPFRDLVGLISRNAFDEPGMLRNPELTESVNALQHSYHNDFVGHILAHNGLPSVYRGLYKELGYKPLGYFALAGIARTGFWDEDWFMEALSRTGYSETAKVELMKMYREQVTYARTSPVMTHVRKGVREGYYTQEYAAELVAAAKEIPVLEEVRLKAIEVETDVSNRDAAANIVLQAFSRGIISESACTESLSQIIVNSEIVNIRMLETKLGIVRKVTVAATDIQQTTIEYMEAE